MQKTYEQQRDCHRNSHGGESAHHSGWRHSPRLYGSKNTETLQLSKA
jgi:hypothetical protein